LVEPGGWGKAATAAAAAVAAAGVGAACEKPRETAARALRQMAAARMEALM